MSRFYKKPVKQSELVQKILSNITQIWCPSGHHNFVADNTMSDDGKTAIVKTKQYCRHCRVFFDY